MNNKSAYFWAKTTPEKKPGISVYDHMINIGCVARCMAELVPDLLNRFQLESATAGALAALHDLGKISPGFQRKCEDWLKDNNLTKIDRNGCWDTGMESYHSKVSHSAIQSFLNEKNIDRSTAKFVSAVLGGHHGRLSPPNDRGYHPQKAISESFSHIKWEEERMENAHRIWDYFTDSNTSLAISDESPSLWWLAGLTTVADWIGSNEQFFSPEDNSTQRPALESARKALDIIGFSKVKYRAHLSFHDLFHDPDKPDVWSPNEMQQKAVDNITGPGVYVIEAPMGMGKTEAALWAAYGLLAAQKATGIYFALPTQATSNRMHLRMSEFIRRITDSGQINRLVHGNSWLLDTEYAISPSATDAKAKSSEDARAGRDWFSSTKRALLAPFGVGTVDQALLGIVAAKHFFVRHFALAGKVVILDEVHSYDLYTGTLIDKLITTLEGLGCTVIILSATLTERRLGNIVALTDSTSDDGQLPYPLITGRNEGIDIPPASAKPPVPQDVKVVFLSDNDAAKEAISLAQKAGSVLWICNTVDSAQKQYQALKEHANNKFPLGLLHSRFPYWRREQLEDEWLERFGKEGTTRCGSILVSTQIVEQSVDLDADLIITELAPTDMLLQRLGRLWRHKRDGRPAPTPRMIILEELHTIDEFRDMPPKAIVNALGGKGKVYAPFVLMRSLEVWKHLSEVSLPEEVRNLIESTYIDRDSEPKSWNELYNNWFGTDSAKKMSAYRNCNLWQVALEDEEGVQTRLNELITIPVILCKSLSDKEAVFINQTKIRLGDKRQQLSAAQGVHKNLVRVPDYCFDNIENTAVFADFIYGPQIAGVVEESGEVNVKGLNENYSLTYNDNSGLLIKKR